MRLFERPETKLNQERVCNLNANSKHFYAFINRLEDLASWNKTGKLRKSDIPDFARVCSTEDETPRMQSGCNVGNKSLALYETTA